MTDLYYKFPDQPTALEALSAAGMTYTDDDGVEHPSQGGHDYALWEVGEIDGVEGWHINVRLVNDSFDVSNLEQYVVHPTNPRVVWAAGGVSIQLQAGSANTYLENKPLHDNQHGLESA